MTKSRIRRTGSGYKAVAMLGHPARAGKARLSFRTLRGRSDGSARRRQVLPEEISTLVRSHRTTAAAMQWDRGREVSKGRSSSTGRRAESFSSRSRGKDFDGRKAAERRQAPRRRWGGRNSFHAAWTAANVYGIRSDSILDSQFDGAGMRPPESGPCIPAGSFQ